VAHFGTLDERVEPDDEGLLVLVGEPIELVVELMELQRMGPTRELPVPAG